ncbi:hypothetical protein ESY86_04370 [Subsaximicrobium wynnwilliamsii]|uniref:Uncharacterized protein n=1 Tax=Subsaximicrobium wynnwilliamsii TaxID=291179 RepID=A0A5C6ZLB1_9FLAO|nr:hypothetical protein [Subsaximicrobium wynnwilliamsii]TXD84938.1 hypothetical protein ESY87_04150 [Subsaximicrobium wynnwilliamsii]TXD90609.1 hypothetical protein ESY86_04370 [Subsaximicrobium wynnwilliamsii]TXE05083.1 hypothetical protein ESY88_02675 [Subsaximicrobium wynnwilliamsii]
MTYNISIYHENVKKVRYFTTGIGLTEKEFDTIWLNPENKKLRGTNKEIILKLKAIEKRANDEAKAMSVFDFSKFESKLF